MKRVRQPRETPSPTDEEIVDRASIVNPTLTKAELEGLGRRLREPAEPFPNRPSQPRKFAQIDKESRLRRIFRE